MYVGAMTVWKCAQACAAPETSAELPRMTVGMHNLWLEFSVPPLLEFSVPLRRADALLRRRPVLPAEGTLAQILIVTREVLEYT